ncbi:MAG: 2-hydroxychromene-2-carboxylate isomerase, partial [bacterium]
MLSTKTQNRLRALARLRRRASGSPRRVHYFHQVDDPYSHLAAQCLERMLKNYNVHLRVHLVGGAGSGLELSPERQDLAIRDCAEIARHFETEFPAVPM